MKTTNVQPLTTAYAKLVENKIQDAYSFLEPAKRPIVQVEAGRKYFKLVASYFGNQRSVHSFVDRVTGDVFKPAGWAAPAKGVRYNVVSDFDTLAAAIDPYGSYLYIR